MVPIQDLRVSHWELIDFIHTEELNRFMKNPARSKSLSSKVTETEYRIFQQLASEKGLTPSEYLRVMVQERVYCSAELRVMVASHVRMEKLVLVLLANLANGQKLTNEQISKLASDVDKAKFQVADARISEALNAPSAVKLAAAMENGNA